MSKVLIVVDMQNDFIDGMLGTQEAQAIVNHVVEKIKDFDGQVFYTRDTHEADYMDTMEGKNLPVVHCIKGSFGWEIKQEVLKAGENKLVEIIDKPTFGSVELADRLAELQEKEAIENITLIGVCTDICVISNAINIKSRLWKTPIFVEASCCAGVTPASHNNALEAMKMCQIAII